ncbi:MAG: glutamine--fructose-6-phosphate transaminase (isomerizing), partial [Boseongicola sp.]|nr:glutamine--fructose-6-phosphate transaminase (isomerizing) [Boseongicola sp.]
LADAIKHYVTNDGLALPENTPDFSQIDRVIMVACGTAYLACATAKYWIEKLAQIPVEVDIASEFRYRTPPIGPRTLAIFVSQSGETADTLAALRHVAEKAQILSVVNVAESSIARESDVALPILAGTEIGVASTKAFTCQLTVLLALALKAAQDRDLLPDTEVRAYLGDLRSLPGRISSALNANESIATVAQDLSKARDILFLGRGQMYPIALEGALKLKEISYIHAEGYASGELKHGPIALIDPAVPVIVIAPRDTLFDKTVSNMQEVMARGGKVVLVTDTSGAKVAGDGTMAVITMPEIPDLLAPILYAIPAQLIAYHTAVAKGTDVDQPRNLAKSVTVE